MMDDLRLAARQMRNAPGFAAAAVLTLALGIGANTAMFTVIDSVLIRPMPYPKADRLVSIGQSGREDFGATSWPTLQDLRKQSQTLADVGGYVTDVAILQGNQGGKTLLGTKVTCNVLGLLGVRPALGRAFAASDCVEGAAPTVLLSDSLWRQDFGTDPHIVGKTVRIGNVAHTVIGVMPTEFSFPQEAGAGTAAKGIWLPSRLSADIRRRGFTLYQMIGRLRPSATINQARAELTAAATDIRREDPKEAVGLSFSVRSYRETITGAVRPVFYALAAALGLVLLIACANVANLQLSRCLARQHELSVRAALGAPKWRLVRELLIESGVLSLVGALVGLQLALGILQLLRLLPEDLIPRASEIQLRWGVLAMLAGLATAATMLSGIVPALVAMRAEPQAALRGSGRGVSQRAGSTRMAGWLVIGEVAIAGVLLVGCSLLFHTLYNLQHKPLGFGIADVVTFTATPPTSAGYLAGTPSGDQERPAIARQVYAPLLAKLRALPGVKQAALASSIPFDGVDLGTSFSVDGRKNKTPEEKRAQDAVIRVMSGGYMQAIGTPLVKGRAISDGDSEESLFVAVINEVFARKFFPGKDALGQTLNLGGKETGMEKPYTIVGVAADAAQKNLVDRAEPEMLLSYRQVPEHSLFYPILLGSATKFVVRAATGQRVSGEIRSAVRREAPGFAIDDLQTMQATVDKADLNQRLGFYLTGGFAGIAVAMVMVGLYGVLTQLVSQRRQEIGVRVALGATSGSIMGMILRQGGVLIAAGTVVGLLAAGALGRTIQSFLYGMRATDGWSYAGATMALLGVGLVAALIPARRASAIEPVEALRAE